jgi:hypothetical protein
MHRPNVVRSILAFAAIQATFVADLSPRHAYAEHCGCLDFTCSASHRNCPSVSTPSIAQGRLNSWCTMVYRDFTILNKSRKPVDFSWLRYEPKANDASHRGDWWDTEGWWTVNPGETKLVYRTDSCGGKTFYVYLRSSGSSLVPRKFLHKVDSCVMLGKAFELRENPGPSFSMSARGERTRTGRTCSEVGGTLVTFYKMDIDTKFTVD